MKGFYLLLLQATFFSLPFAQNSITIGNGTSTQGAPVSRFFRYHASEFIYLQSEINEAGTIESVAFNKQSGTNNNIIENVEIYMRHTPITSLSGGTTSTAGYTLVFSGNFTNNAATGWMEVQLNTPFLYNNTDNLEILIIKGNQAPLTSAQFPRYTFTTVSGNRIRSYSDDSIPWSETRNMSASTALPNITMTITPNCEPTFSNLTETTCDTFELNGVQYTESGTYTQELTNAAGCDSTITLDLTVIEIDTDVEIDGLTLVAVPQNDASYIWTDCGTGIEIPGANSSTYTPVTNGLYQVRIAIGDCAEFSECIDFNVLNIDDFVDDLFNIYPNPVSDNLSIQMSYADFKMSITDISGGLIFSNVALQQGMNQVDLKSLLNGIYILRIESDTKILHHRIVKQ